MKSCPDSHRMDFLGGASGKETACQCRRHNLQAQSLGLEDPLEEGMATHSSILAWRIPWMEESGGLQSIGSYKRSHMRPPIPGGGVNVGLLRPFLKQRARVSEMSVSAM